MTGPRSDGGTRNDGGRANAPRSRCATARDWCPDDACSTCHADDEPYTAGVCDTARNADGCPLHRCRCDDTTTAPWDVACERAAVVDAHAPDGGRVATLAVVVRPVGPSWVPSVGRWLQRVGGAS